MADIFKHDSYTQTKTRLMQGYVDMQVAHLQVMHPEQPRGKLEEFVRTQVLQRLQRPQVDILTHPQYGVTKRVTIDLLEHVNAIGNAIIAPSGTLYTPPVRKEDESLLRLSLEDNVKKRSEYKHVMLEAKERGDDVAAQIANFQQASTKIFNNSIPGAMGSPHNCLYDLPGYNSVTSTSRHSVRAGYAHVEKVIEGNLLLPTMEDVINYVTLLHRQCPPLVLEVVQKYGLYVPSVEDVVEHFACSMRYYCFPPRDQLRVYIGQLPLATRIFAFYASCLKTLVRFNDQFFKAFFCEFFRTDLTIDPAVEPGAIYKLVEKDLLAMVTSLNYELIGREKLEDAIKTKPDGVRHLIAIAQHMNAMLVQHGDLFTVFFRVDADTPRVAEYPAIIRKTVLVSDTDSVIFSTQSMVEWYAGGPVFTRAAYEINAFTVYMISRTLEHVFARLSMNFGMVGRDVYRISMKNEFLYPIMLRTPIGKHYAGLIAIQEGKILPKAQKDIKGLQFRGSDLCATTNDKAEAFLLWILNSATERGQITATEVLAKVVEHELAVYHSVTKGERDYLSMASVKTAEDYDEPMKTDYFYYLVWKEVFAGKFDEFQIPNKGFEIKIVGDGAGLKHQPWLDALKAFDKGTHDRLLNFMERHPMKKISRLILPPTMTVIPEIFRPIVDVRNIIYRNGRPFYLALRALGLGDNFTKGEFLVADFYDTNGVEIPF